MAGIYTPSTTFYTNGVYTITSNKGTPYFMIQNSMGSFQYGVNQIYIQSNTTQQLLQGLSFRSYDVNGDISNFLNVTTVSPYQYQNSLFLKPIRNDIVLDGRTSISFNLLPSENVNFVFYVTEQGNVMFLKEPSLLDDYFFKQQYDFFNGFVKKI
jgi:hypothetical protein